MVNISDIKVFLLFPTDTRFSSLTTAYSQAIRKSSWKTINWQKICYPSRLRRRPEAKVVWSCCCEKRIPSLGGQGGRSGNRIRKKYEGRNESQKKEKKQEKENTKVRIYSLQHKKKKKQKGNSEHLSECAAQRGSSNIFVYPKEAKVSKIGGKDSPL